MDYELLIAGGILAVAIIIFFVLSSKRGYRSQMETIEKSTSSHINHYKEMRDKITIAQDAPEEEEEQEEDEGEGQPLTFSEGILALLGGVSVIMIIIIAIVAGNVLPGVLKDAGAANTTEGIGSSVQTAVLGIGFLVSIAGIGLFVARAFGVFR